MDIQNWLHQVTLRLYMFEIAKRDAECILKKITRKSHVSQVIFFRLW